MRGKKAKALRWAARALTMKLVKSIEEQGKPVSWEAAAIARERTYKRMKRSY